MTVGEVSVTLRSSIWMFGDELCVLPLGRKGVNLMLS